MLLSQTARDRILNLIHSFYLIVSMTKNAVFNVKYRSCSLSNCRSLHCMYSRIIPMNNVTCLFIIYNREEKDMVWIPEFHLALWLVLPPIKSVTLNNLNTPHLKVRLATATHRDLQLQVTQICFNLRPNSCKS